MNEKKLVTVFFTKCNRWWIVGLWLWPWK